MAETVSAVHFGGWQLCTFNGDLGINTMLVVEIDPFGLQLLQRGRDATPDVGGLAILLVFMCLNIPGPKLRGQEDLRTAASFGEPVAYDLFA